MPKRMTMKVRLAVTLGAVLVACALPASSGAFRLEGGRWPTSAITYYNEVPAYNWAVDTAAYAWNTSGARVQFVKSRRQDAKVLLGIRWFKVAGDANVQRVNGRFLGAKVGIRTGQDRFTMTLVVAHELGHVLGLDHENTDLRHHERLSRGRSPAVLSRRSGGDVDLPAVTRRRCARCGQPVRRRRSPDPRARVLLEVVSAA